MGKHVSTCQCSECRTHWRLVGQRFIRVYECEHCGERTETNYPEGEKVCPHCGESMVKG